MVIDFRPQKNCGKDVVSPSKRPFLHGLVHGGVAQTGVYGPRAPPGMHSIVTWVCLGSQTPSLKRHENVSQFSILVVTLFCAYHLIYSMVNLFHPWKLCHPLKMSMQKKTTQLPTFPTSLTPPTFSPPKKKNKKISCTSSALMPHLTELKRFRRLPRLLLEEAPTAAPYKAP